MFFETMEALRHMLWPTRCASCDMLLAEPSMLVCEECRASVEADRTVFVPENIDAAMAIFQYQGAVQSMISKWKYHEDYAACKAVLSFIPEYIEELRKFIPEGACMIPVPPHPKRLRERGFDPVWSFASKLHHDLRKANIQVEFRDDVLIRTRHTAHQAGLNHEERMHNLENAFKVVESIEGRNILLVDDVMTTGATGSACASVLKSAGCSWIGFIALAHTNKT